MTNLKLLASLTPAGAPKPEGGTILSDLAALCPADSVSSVRTAERWTLRAYETASGVSGTMLTAGVYTQPPAVTVTPQVTGLCRIYVCLGDLDGGNTKIDLRLSGDATWHRMHCGNMGVGHWSVFEYLEESYWRIADMTGEKAIEEEVDDNIRFFNEERPAYSLGYLTPKQYKERHSAVRS